MSINASMFRVNRFWFAWGLLLASFFIRMAAVGVLRDWRDGPLTRHGADGIEYDLLASRLATDFDYSYETGKPTSFRAPGFPVFLAVVYKTLGKDYLAARLLLCLLGALAVVLIYLLARELLDESRAKWAGSLAALYQPHLLFATRFDSENLYIPLLAAGLLLGVRQLRRSSVSMSALTGVLLGCAALTRPFALLILPVMLSVMIWEQSRTRRYCMPALIALTVAFFATVSVWTARNFRVHGRFVAIATNGGSTFYGGNNSLVAHEFTRLGSWVSTGKLPGRDAIEATRDEVAHDRMEWSLGLDWVRRHPSLMPQLLLAKAIRFMGPDIDAPKPLYIIFTLLTVIPFMVLYTLGAIETLRRPEYWTAPWLLLHGVFLATLATALIFWGSPRFRDSITPVLMIYAAVCLKPRHTGQESVSSHPENSTRLKTAALNLGGSEAGGQRP